MDNMNITIKNLTITYQNNSLFHYETDLKIRFEELVLFTTDGKGNKKFVSKEDTLHRTLSITKLSIMTAFR